MDFTNENIVYLENEDFDTNGKLKHKFNKPVVVMIQGNFCGYCKQMKPAFDEFSKKMKDRVIAATIQIDGNDSEKALAKRLDNILGFKMQGVPTVCAISQDGKVREYKGDRSEATLIEFANGL